MRRLWSKTGMVTLVAHPLSPYAQKVKIVLAEQGVACTRRLYDEASVSDEPC